MDRERVLALALCLACACALLVTTQAVSADPPPSTATAGATPTATPIVYEPDRDGCPRYMPGTGGAGGGRDVFETTGNSAVLFRLDNQGDPVSNAYFSKDGRTIVTEGEALRLWDASSQRLLKVLRDERGFVATALSPDGKKVAALLGNDLVEILNAQTGRAERSIAVPKVVVVPSDEGETVWTIAYNGQLVAAARGSVAYVWDAASGRELLRLKPRPTGNTDGDLPEFTEGHASSIYALSFTPNQKALLSAGWDDVIRLWDLASGKHIRCYELDDGGDLASADTNPLGRTMDISSNGRTIAAVTRSTRDADGFSLSVWDALTRKLLRQISAPKSQRFESVSLSPDGETVAASSSDLAARLWDVKTGTLKGVMRHPAHVSSVAFSPVQPWVVTGLKDLNEPGGMQPGENAAWVWDVKHKNVSLAAKAETLLAEGAALGEQGKLQEAAAKFRQAASLNPDRGYPMPTADILSDVCWFGALNGRARQVLSFCEQAIELKPDGVYAHDSRGLARALAGNAPGAIADFSFVLKWLEAQNTGPSSPPVEDPDVEDRTAWIKALKAGKNTPDPATLMSLEGH